MPNLTHKYNSCVTPYIKIKWLSVLYFLVENLFLILMVYRSIGVDTTQKSYQAEIP